MRRWLPVVILLLLANTGCLPEGFAERTTQQGLVLPTSFAFAPDGRLFVAEKRGTIQTFDSVDDPTPSLFADLRDQVRNAGDHGLLGVEVDRSWPARPYVYIHYAYDAGPGGTAPTQGIGTDSDPCPLGVCLGQGRVARLTAGPGPIMTAQQVLVEDVCFGTAFHGGGGVRMAPDGSLFATFGDGGLPAVGGVVGDADDGCGDPPGERGSLRSQDLRSAGDPTGLGGALIRINADTGAPWPTNPLINSPDPQNRKIVAFGLRSPFRMELRPGTTEAWVADVGFERAEEINRVIPGAPVENFGWPCMEGMHREPLMDARHTFSCDALYWFNEDTKPFFAVCHAPTPPGELCRVGGGSLSGLAFYKGGPYPDKYDGALFFADYTHQNIQVMLPTNGIPDPAKIDSFGIENGAVVEVRTGPNGDLFFLDIFEGRLQRIFIGTPPTGNPQRPRAIIDRPPGGSTYVVGEQIAFSGRATDAAGNPLPASALRWDLIQRHCPTEDTCHRHFVESREGVTSGSFTAIAHESPSHIEIGLTATSAGITDVSTVAVTQVQPGARTRPRPPVPIGPGDEFLQ